MADPSTERGNKLAKKIADSPVAKLGKAIADSPRYTAEQADKANKKLGKASKAVEAVPGKAVKAAGGQVKTAGQKIQDGLRGMFK